ncbi:transcriptional regulator [Parashewanella curva]|uniref:Transcriptional regulator n=1 Tax=Parashewanella curva TaxID=2338552 RepID=A0A3L8Q1Z4_9GAMM|nr:ChrR family anti-sigma-E factor [Parashewanella curva]RLV61615.1 transcriptional regulator [Parashewanella curva]
MINYHPDSQLLTSYVSGELMTSFSCAVAIHLEKCPSCRHKAESFIEQKACHAFQFEESNGDSSEFDGMLNAILSDDGIDTPPINYLKEMEIGGEQFTLPRALSKLSFGKASSIGKISRSRAKLDEGSVRTSLMHIEAGGKVPQHTHKGYELTLVLSGKFKDESGEYSEGDFIFLEGKHKHQPVSVNGCLCMTIVSDSLHFTQGINKLLNPIGTYIY